MLCLSCIHNAGERKIETGLTIYCYYWGRYIEIDTDLECSRYEKVI